MPIALTALITVLTEMPQLINGAQRLWSAISTFHAAGLITLTTEQLAAMNAAGVTLDADVAALRAAAGQKPTA